MDTCTLKHADDPSSKYFDYSIEFITKMIKSNLNGVVDEGFHLDESQNRSYIGLEYTKHLKPGSLGYNLIVKLLTEQRISIISNVVERKVKKVIEQNITNKKDRIFLRVAYNSKEKILASHDFTDYSRSKRKYFRKEIGTSIVTAQQANDFI